MAVVEAVARAFPAHYTRQDELTTALISLWRRRPFNVQRLRDMHAHMEIDGRHHAVALSELEGLDTFGKCNDAYIRESVPLASQAVASVLASARLPLESIQHVFFVSITGVATPSIDARLCNAMHFPRTVKRTPIFGLGCAAGAAGLARAADYVRGAPTQRALLIAVELCSLTVQRNDCSVPNAVACGLFGDGAAAAVVAGDACEWPHAVAQAMPHVIASRSVLFPHTENMLGWRVGGDGFSILLAGEIPALLERSLREHVDAFLQSERVCRDDIDYWLCHPGGPKVLEAVMSSLALTREDLAVTYAGLRQFGNLSSASVLLALEDTMTEQPARGSIGLMMAFGPGFAIEFVLLAWR